MAKIRVERREDGVAVVWLDHPDKSVNTLSPDLVGEFEQEGEDRLSDSWRAVGRHVGDGDPALPRRVQVDHVVAGGQHADVFQVRELFDV